MEQNVAAGQSCPACGRPDYLFRGRKRVVLVPGPGEVVETKYRCRACDYE